MMLLFKNKVLWALLVSVVGAINLAAYAEENSVTKSAQTPVVLETWGDFASKLPPLGQQLIERIPTRLRDNPQIQQQAYRLLMMATSRTVNDALVGDRQYPMFVPELNLALNIYQPNADTVYKSALIEAGGVYQISGNRGSILFAKLGQLGPDMIRTGVASAPISYLDLDTLKIDSQGRYSVIVSNQRPEGYQGDWWQLDNKAEKVMLRQISYNWAAEVDTTIAIDRLDTPAARPPLRAQQMNDNLQELPSMILNAAIFFVDHVEALREQGYLNKLKVYDLSNMAGLENQSYYEGGYEIGEDEALVVEVKLPKVCKYWSLILTNDLYQTTDWANNHSSLNGGQATVDADGYFRAVISAKDPGVVNWLDTAGFLSGAIQGRWLECSGAPMPTVTKMAMDKVKNYLPVGTAAISTEQRETVIRERRVAYQLRRLW